MATPKEILRIGDREVDDLEPGQGLLPGDGLHQARPRPLLPRGRRRRAARRRRPADGAEALRRRRRRRAVLPEAGARTTGPTGSGPSTLTFPSGRTADEIVLDDAAGLAWIANLGCIDLNPHPVRADDLDHPDELRVDLDPVPGVAVAADPRGRAGRARGARGGRARRLAQDVRLARHPHQRPHRAALDVRRGAPRGAGARARRRAARARRSRRRKWWKEERHGVFLDYNQNAKDRTVASAYSVRPLPDARVSTPLRWDEVADRRGRGVHARDGAGALRRDRRPGRRDRRRRSGRSRRCSSCQRARRGRGPGRRAVAAALRASRPASRRASSRRGRAAPTAEYEPGRGEAGGPPPEVAAERGRRGRRRRPERGPADRVGRLAADADRPAQDVDPGHRDRPGASPRTRRSTGLERWKARHPEVAALPRAGRRPGRRDARPLRRSGTASG